MVERAKYENKMDRNRLMKDFAREDYIQKNRQIIVKIILIFRQKNIKNKLMNGELNQKK